MTGRARHRLALAAIALILAFPPALATAECRPQSQMRLRVLRTRDSLVGSAKQKQEAIFDDLSQRYESLRDDFEDLSGPEFAYLEHLDLPREPVERPSKLAGYFDYFEGKGTLRNLQVITSTVREANGVDHYGPMTYVGLECPFSKASKGCYFKEKRNRTITIPPDDNYLLIVERQLALTLYALSLDADEKCTDDVLAALNRALLSQIRFIDDEKHWKFNRMKEIRGLPENLWVESSKVKAWLKRHRRFHVHFIPTSSSWLNVIERFFRDLDANRPRRGVFQSVPDLIDAVMAYVEGHNEDPSPFVWSKTAEEILEKVGRARRVLA